AAVGLPARDGDDEPADQALVEPANLDAEPPVVRDAPLVPDREVRADPAGDADAAVDPADREAERRRAVEVVVEVEGQGDPAPRDPGGVGLVLAGERGRSHQGQVARDDEPRLDEAADLEIEGADRPLQGSLVVEDVLAVRGGEAATGGGVDVEIGAGGGRDERQEGEQTAHSLDSTPWRPKSALSAPP